MAAEQSGLFYAYVGAGEAHQAQADVVLAYPRLLTRARAAHNEQAVKGLEAAGPPPYANAEKYLVPLLWANTLDPPLRFPISAAGLWTMRAPPPFLTPAGQFSASHLLKPILTENLSAAAPRLDVPVIIIAGSEDLVTPCAKVFLDAVRAPHKEFLTINGGGHLAIMGRNADFLELLVSHVRPLAK